MQTSARQEPLDGTLGQHTAIAAQHHCATTSVIVQAMTRTQTTNSGRTVCCHHAHSARDARLAVDFPIRNDAATSQTFRHPCVVGNVTETHDLRQILPVRIAR